MKYLFFGGRVSPEKRYFSPYISKKKKQQVWYRLYLRWGTVLQVLKGSVNQHGRKNQSELTFIFAHFFKITVICTALVNIGLFTRVF